VAINLSGHWGPRPLRHFPALRDTPPRYLRSRGALQFRSSAGKCITTRPSENERGELSFRRRSSTVLAVVCAGPDGFWQTFFVNQFLHLWCSGTRGQGWTSSGLRLGIRHCSRGFIYLRCKRRSISAQLRRFSHLQRHLATKSFSNVKNTDGRLSISIPRRVGYNLSSRREWTLAEARIIRSPLGWMVIPAMRIRRVARSTTNKRQFHVRLRHSRCGRFWHELARHWNE
jgi:hypothetical protein